MNARARSLRGPNQTASASDRVVSIRLGQSGAAAYLGLASSTLAKLRCRGGGPAFLKLGRRVVYDQHDLDDWLDARRRLNTSQK
jgi:hypothetical protein